ncbi:MAG: hypothetical protein KOO63_09355 [Bacteroidales bacterium]|nr:hypothetical protein [Candidatus Latescibacterota bacterium]
MKTKKEDERYVLWYSERPHLGHQTPAAERLYLTIGELFAGNRDGRALNRAMKYNTLAEAHAAIVNMTVFRMNLNMPPVYPLISVVTRSQWTEVRSVC